MTSQTSFPSQSGPIDSNIVCRSPSSLPRTGSSIPTPKSKPSVTKYPVQKKASSTNQRISRVMA